MSYYEENRTSRSSSPLSGPGVLDFAFMDLIECESHLKQALKEHNGEKILDLHINNNLLSDLHAPSLLLFNNLIHLDLSSNQLKVLPPEVLHLQALRRLILKNNLFDDNSLPKELGECFSSSLEVINLTGNLFTQFPYQLFDLINLREIYLGANKISNLPPKNYELLAKLEILYLGGNLITQIPHELSGLINLRSLNLSDNQITSLPTSLANLKYLISLAVHNNNLTTLPIELVRVNLNELSLRNNPLVSRFVRELDYIVPSLLELSGRVIKMCHVNYSSDQLPTSLAYYLNSAKCCLNPKCKGVYFTSKVETIKFVDFCGKYRVPFMQYLCSPKCNNTKKPQFPLQNSFVSSSSESDSDDYIDNSKLKKVLLG
jgi:Leucine-rich repeat (LRR) protein